MHIGTDTWRVYREMASDECGTNAESQQPHGLVAGTEPSLHGRRAIVRGGVKLAFAAPVLSTFFASQAYATNYSCYPEGHTCDYESEEKRQACCGTLVCKDAGGDPVSEGESGTCEPP